MMKPADNHPLHAAIHQKLADIVEAGSTPPVWQEAWLRLEPDSTDEECLAVYRAVRDAGSVPGEAGFFLIAWILDMLTDRKAEEGLRAVEERLEAVRKKHGLDEDTPADADGVPPEYREAMQQANEAWDALYVSTMEQHGKHELARVFREEPERYEQLYEAGRQFFHGADEVAGDEWLDILLDAVAACVEADSPMGPLGLRYSEEGGFWDVTIYPTPVEVVGGAHDGEVVAPGFLLHLDEFQQAFDSVADFGWNALGLNDPDGPYVWLEGVFKGRQVYVQVLAYPPEDEGPGLKLDATRRQRPRQ